MSGANKVYRIIILMLTLLLPVQALPKNSVIKSPHNLSASGPGNYRSLSTRQVCVFCHAPHSVVPDSPLWNREDTGQTYTQYSSSTMVADPGQPAGSSRLCLACHDGTVALERLAVMPNGARGLGLSKRLAGRSNLGTDLADDHPISFVYDAALASDRGDLAHPATVALPMDNGAVRCGTCHDPHDSTWPPFLNLSSMDGELCTECHEMSGSNWAWRRSSHATSAARPRGPQPWPERKPQWRGKTVAENACFNCHTPHNATTPVRLISDREEDTCFRCHDGTVAKSDIQNDLLKPSRHPVDVTPNFDHDAAQVEDPLRMRLHVECGDCHDPHGVESDQPMITVDNNRSTGGTGYSRVPRANARIAGVSGISSGGLVKEEIDYQYEMCFKCHGVPGKSACGNSRCSTARAMNHQRADFTYNLRDKFDPDSNSQLQSYHPVVRNDPFNNGTVPSLRQELGMNDISTLIYCTDCHNSDQSSAGTGNGAEGPHGSIYSPILAERYSLRPVSFGAASSETALCFKCHEEGVLKNPATPSGYLHLSHENNGTCIACHDPHGSTRGPHLINFGTRNDLAPAGGSTRIIGAGSAPGTPLFIETAEGGECWLKCHTGPEHLGWPYIPEEDPMDEIGPTPEVFGGS